MSYDKELPPQAANDAGTGTSVRLYTATTSSKVNALPNEWQGKQINIRCAIAATDSIHWFLTRVSTATCDTAIAATDSGVTLTPESLGGTLLPGEIARVRVPDGPGTIYLCRHATATGTLRCWLSGTG